LSDWRLGRSFAVAFALCVLLSGSGAHAQQADPAELDALKKMIEEVLAQNEALRKRVRDLEEAMKERAPGPAGGPPAVVGTTPKVPEQPVIPEVASEPIKTAREKIQLGGALEVEAGTRKEFNRVRSSDIALTTAEFDFEADVVDWAKAELSLQWDSAADKITVNEGLITIAKPSVVPVYLKTGRGVVPFGTSTGTSVAARFEESLTITGPLTIEAFEAKEDYAQLGVRSHGFNGGIYLFNGTTDNRQRGKHLEHWGVTVGYGMKTDLVSFDVGVDWMDSIFDTDGLTAAFPELQTRPKRAYTPGFSAHGRFGIFGFSLIAEYDGATQQVHFTRSRRDVKTMPEAWQVELGYMTKVFGVRPFAAFNYSATAGMFGGFPERRLLGTVGTFVTDNIRVALEYNNEQDYPRIQGGTGREAEAWTLRLTYEW